MTGELKIVREEKPHRATFFVERDGERLGQMTMKKTGEKQYEIDHTVVDDVLKGQGVARKLLDTAVAWARENGAKYTATCPYAKAQFEKDASIRDVLVG